MSQPRPDHLPADLCPCLMTKTMNLNTEYRRTAYEHSFLADTALFHCLVTMCGQGPDDDDVEPEKCRPGRGCYSPDVDFDPT